MNKRITTSVLITLWALVFAVTALFATKCGFSPSTSILLASLVAYLFNGTITYVGLRRTSGEQQMGSYLQFLIRPKLADTPVTISRPIRAAAALAMIVGAGLFLLITGIIVSTLLRPHAHSYLTGLLSATIIGAIGLGALYVGFRLLVVRDGERLFPGRKHAKSDKRHAT